MTWRQYLLLAMLGLVVTAFVASFEPSPGYLDADYYFAGGLQLVNGQGFTEPYIWNYLDDPSGLPHASFSYWMPLASLLAAAGMSLFGPSSWIAARIGFLAVAASIPPMTAALAYVLVPRRDLAMCAGFLAVFSCYYLPFLPTSDTFGLYMLLGCLFFLIFNRNASRMNSILLGLVAGLMHLARADGLLWLGLAFLGAIYQEPAGEKRGSRMAASVVWTLIGYTLVMGPWLARNLIAFGTLLAPGGSRSLWLTYYDQLFTYPATGLSLSSWWQSGLVAILKVRLWAFGINLANTLAVQGEVILIPFIGIGLWGLRKDRRVQAAVLAFLLTIGAMTIVFPFAGARGGFFHSGAAVQPVWWAVAPFGLEQLIAWGARRRGWVEKQARWVFQAAMVGTAALITAVIVFGRVTGPFSGEPAWGREVAAYRQIGRFLTYSGQSADSIVVVANPPGFYLASGHPAIALPDGDLDTLLFVARRYEAKIIVLEKGSTPDRLLPVLEDPSNQAGLHYLGEVEEARIFVIQP